jgi:peptidoglycan/xylan/chitin deacetylase (PgdA/CDA1 family)
MTVGRLVWRALDSTGISHICSLMTGGRLQILCYHGFSFEDEYLFRGRLFMAPAVFQRRLEWLKTRGYRVLDLGDALTRLRGGTLKHKEIVITIDDGFYSVFALAAPLLRAYGMRATLYLTSYYVKHGNPIFRLAIQYMAWKSKRDEVDLSGLLTDSWGPIVLRGPRVAEGLQKFYEFAEERLTEQERVSTAREFGIRVGVDYDELLRSRRLSLMSAAEIRDLSRQGFDIQLHTHRHRLPTIAAEISREITDNRAELSTMTDGPLEHFCYPSGIWDPCQWPVLSTLGIRSATTCLPGFNTRATPLLGLRRFLDGQEIPMEEFAMEMSGIKDLYRRLRSSETPAA